MNCIIWFLALAATLTKALPSNNENYYGGSDPNAWAVQSYEEGSSAPYQGYTSPSPALLTSDEYQGDYIDAEPIARSTRHREEQARSNFIATARAMNDDRGDAQLKNRFGTYATDVLMDDLLSNNDHRMRLATASILMHRTSQSNAFNRRGSQLTYTDRPIYGDYTKKDILDRIFEVMGVAPTEDVRQWWYSLIVKNKGVNTFPKLYSDNRQEQIDAINYLSGLFYVNGFWVKTDPNASSWH